MSSTTTPVRITTIQYLRAAIAEALGIEPDHEGADTFNWDQELREMRLADYQEYVSRAREVPTAVIPAVRPELPAIAPVPHREVIDEHLGTLRIASLEPARIYAALIGDPA